MNVDALAEMWMGLGLPTRVARALAAEGFDPEAVGQMTDLQLLRIPEMGRKSITLVREIVPAPDPEFLDAPEVLIALARQLEGTAKKLRHLSRVTEQARKTVWEATWRAKGIGP